MVSRHFQQSKQKFHLHARLLHSTAQIASFWTKLHSTNKMTYARKLEARESFRTLRNRPRSTTDPLTMREHDWLRVLPTNYCVFCAWMNQAYCMPYSKSVCGIWNCILVNVVSNFWKSILPILVKFYERNKIRDHFGIT